MDMVSLHLYRKVLWGEAGLCPLPVLLLFSGLAGKVIWGFGTGICLSSRLALPSQIVVPGAAAGWGAQLISGLTWCCEVWLVGFQRMLVCFCFQKAKIIGEWSGLRPARPSVRLERESIRQGNLQGEVLAQPRGLSVTNDRVNCAPVTVQ